MRAISLWQPWATYVAIGAKRFETRSWGTAYRGPLAIHAAKRPLSAGERELLSEWPLPFGSGELPFGAIVATCTLADCYEIQGSDWLGEREEALGDWYPGRFAWALTNVVRVNPPVYVRGAQGFWNWEPTPDGEKGERG